MHLSNTKKYISVCILLLTFFSVNQWSSIQVGNSVIERLLSFALCLFIILDIKRHKGLFRFLRYKLVCCYAIWMIIGIIRGAFVAENYWEYNQLTIGGLALSLPLFTCIFYDKRYVMYILRIWFRWAIPLFFLFFMWIVPPGGYHFYLGPVFVIGCFLPCLPTKWKIIIGGLLLGMLLVSLGARSQVIKSAVVLLMAIGYYFRKHINENILKFAHWIFYIGTIILLILGISGQFNIFQDLSSNRGKYTEKKKVNGVVTEEDLATDTRSFIYEEVIYSAIKHNYILFGRTPARGNDSMFFEDIYQARQHNNKLERHKNELCHTNVFTWLGLVGIVLYSLIYLCASYLAVYRSRSFAMKLIGCFIAFRWMFGWIEDANLFNISNIALWILISMGLSTQFREMTDIEFQRWIRCIFPKKRNILKQN